MSPASRGRGLRVARVASAFALVFSLISVSARADDPPRFDAAHLLEPSGPSLSFGTGEPVIELVSIDTRFSYFDQRGHGYQSRDGALFAPGGERATVWQPQLDVVMKQGKRWTHRVWVPVDIVTAASPDAIDAISTASQQNEAASVDWTATYDRRDGDSLSIRNGFHNEENLRSWNIGTSASWSLAEDNATLEVRANGIFDWFDKYRFNGKHDGHASRSTTNLNVALTQILSPTTVAHVNYGISYQAGQLGNGWNTVTLTDRTRELELLPRERLRHALVARVAQYLPWQGALHALYRLYLDDWGSVAHTAEFELDQRISPISFFGFVYRHHRQNGVRFYTEVADPSATLATSDSDLAPLSSNMIGLHGRVDILRAWTGARVVHGDVAVERYFRDNDLAVTVLSCGLGLGF
jgi:hypothetical protein